MASAKDMRNKDGRRDKRQRVDETTSTTPTTSGRDGEGESYALRRLTIRGRAFLFTIRQRDGE